MKKHTYHRIVTGIYLILIGVVLLLNNLSLLPTPLPDFVFTWPMLLIVLGVYFTLMGKFGGIFIFGLGLYFITPQLGLLKVTVFQYWPVLLILLGILFFFKNRKPRCRKFKGRYRRYLREELTRDNSSYVDSTVVFGGDSKQVSSYDFKGGRLVAVFGGLEIDLTNCTLNKEDNLLELEAVFGGISITIPKEWNVKSSIVPVMGGIEDDLYKQNAYVDPAAILNLKGTVVLGGIEIKRV